MNQYVVAGVILLVVGLFLGLIGLIWWKFGHKKSPNVPAGLNKYLVRINWAALTVFLGAGFVWYLGNIKYGNNAALVMLLDVADRANGAEPLQPWVRSWAFAFIVNFLPSAGQWWRWLFKPKGKNLYTSYVISGIDWSLNIVGLYSGYAPFRSPLNFFVLLVVGLAAYIPNFWCQDVAQDGGRILIRSWKAEARRQQKMLEPPSTKPLPSPHGGGTGHTHFP